MDDIRYKLHNEPPQMLLDILIDSVSDEDLQNITASIISGQRDKADKLWRDCMASVQAVSGMVDRIIADDADKTTLYSALAAEVRHMHRLVCDAILNDEAYDKYLAKYGGGDGTL